MKSQDPKILQQTLYYGQTAQLVRTELTLLIMNF